MPTHDSNVYAGTAAGKTSDAKASASLAQTAVLTYLRIVCMTCSSKAEKAVTLSPLETKVTYRPQQTSDEASSYPRASMHQHHCLAAVVCDVLTCMGVLESACVGIRVHFSCASQSCDQLRVRSQYPFPACLTARCEVKGPEAKESSQHAPIPVAACQPDKHAGSLQQLAACCVSVNDCSNASELS